MFRRVPPSRITVVIGKIVQDGYSLADTLDYLLRNYNDPFDAMCFLAYFCLYDDEILHDFSALKVENLDEEQKTLFMVHKIAYIAHAYGITSDEMRFTEVFPQGDWRFRWDQYSRMSLINKKRPTEDEMLWVRDNPSIRLEIVLTLDEGMEVINDPRVEESPVEHYIEQITDIVHLPPTATLFERIIGAVSDAPSGQNGLISLGVHMLDDPVNKDIAVPMVMQLDQVMKSLIHKGKKTFRIRLREVLRDIGCKEYKNICNLIVSDECLSQIIRMSIDNASDVERVLYSDMSDKQLLAYFYASLWHHIYSGLRSDSFFEDDIYTNFIVLVCFQYEDLRHVLGEKYFVLEKLFLTPITIYVKNDLSFIKKGVDGIGDTNYCAVYLGLSQMFNKGKFKDKVEMDSLLDYFFSPLMLSYMKWLFYRVAFEYMDNVVIQWDTIVFLYGDDIGWAMEVRSMLKVLQDMGLTIGINGDVPYEVLRDAADIAFPGLIDNCFTGNQYTEGMDQVETDYVRFGFSLSDTLCVGANSGNARHICELTDLDAGSVMASLVYDIGYFKPFAIRQTTIRQQMRTIMAAVNHSPNRRVRRRHTSLYHLMEV